MTSKFEVHAGQQDAMSARLLLRLEVEELYAAYAGALDEWRLEEWPQFFTEQCRYRVIARENFDRGLPLCIILCESRGMLEDRVIALRKTAMYAPRTMRHMSSGLEIRQIDVSTFHAEANVVVFRSQLGRQTEIRSAGRYIDTIVRDGAILKLRERTCVLDTNVNPGSAMGPM